MALDQDTDGFSYVPFSQAKLIATISDPALRSQVIGGICAALSAFWLKEAASPLRKRNATAEDRFKYLRDNLTILATMQLGSDRKRQFLASATLSMLSDMKKSIKRAEKVSTSELQKLIYLRHVEAISEDINDTLSDALRNEPLFGQYLQSQLRKNSPVRDIEQLPLAIAAFASQRKSNLASSCILELNVSPTSGHAVGVHHQTTPEMDNLLLFDPNIGELCVISTLARDMISSVLMPAYRRHYRTFKLREVLWGVDSPIFNSSPTYR